MRLLALFIVVAVLVIAVLVYRIRHSGTTVHVEPHAAEEIEKAKRR
jgi:hypothetical protein